MRCLVYKRVELGADKIEMSDVKEESYRWIVKTNEKM